MAAKISVVMRTIGGEQITFSYVMGAEKDEPVWLNTQNASYKIVKEDLLAFARAIAQKE